MYEATYVDSIQVYQDLKNTKQPFCAIPISHAFLKPKIEPGDTRLKQKQDRRAVLK